MKLPPKKRPGNPVLADDWNTLVDAITARTPRPSAGMELAFTQGGFIYRVRPNAAINLPTPPLVLVPADDTHVTVTPGYVNGLMPTLDGTALDADPRPLIEITSAITVWIQVAGVFGVPDTYTVTIEYGAALPDPTITASGFSSSWLLGYASLVDEIVSVQRVYTGGNLSCDSFGTLVHWWKI